MRSLSKYTVPELIERSVTAYPEREAIRFKGSSLRYRELKHKTDAFAAALLELGLKSGEKVAIWMPDNPEWIVAYLATAELGGITVGVNGRYRHLDAEYIINHSDASILITTDRLAKFADYVGMLYEMYPVIKKGDARRLNVPGLPFLRNIICCGEGHPGMLNFDEVLRKGEQSLLGNEVGKRREQVMPEDIALIIYTSGTTSRPKGCLVYHQTLTRNSLILAKHMGLTEGEERMYDPMPLCHIVGQEFGLLTALGRGCCRVMVEHFDAGEALELMVSEKCTAIDCFDAMIIPIITHSEFSKYNLELLRKGFVALIPENLRRAHEALPKLDFISAYGSSEAGNVTASILNDEIEIRLETAGAPHPGIKVKIADPQTGNALPQGETGEICIGGWGVMQGYYKNPEETARVIDSDGFFHSGDLGMLRDDGRLMVKGRIKEMIKVGGENVSTVEVEEFLLRHPKVKLAQVIGIPDDRYTEVPAAVVELRPGESSTEEEIIQYCRGKIAGFKVPRYVKFVTEWPMSASKIQKFKLKELF